MIKQFKLDTQIGHSNNVLNYILICVKLYLFHITKPLKTSNFFPACLSMGFDPFNQGKSTSFTILTHHLPTYAFSLLADILDTTKNLRGAIFPKEAREITSFTGFSGLFYILARI